jgi:hypothetical protein
MSSLLELQSAFRTALLGEDDAQAAAAIVNDDIGAAARLSIYRHHVFTTLTAALEATCPVVCRLVDRRFFGWLAERHIREHPPSGPCLVEYGADFADFIATFPACAHLPYLPDVARLEWALNVALHAPEAESVALETLRGIDDAALGRLRLRLHPSVLMLASPWPIAAIWRANGADWGTGVTSETGREDAAERDAVQAEPATVSLDAGDVRLEVRRVADDVVVRVLSAATFAFRSALATHDPLETAVDQALGVDAAFDVAGELHTLFVEGLVVAVGE